MDLFDTFSTLGCFFVIIFIIPKFGYFSIYKDFYLNASLKDKDLSLLLLFFYDYLSYSYA